MKASKQQQAHNESIPRDKFSEAMEEGRRAMAEATPRTCIGPDCGAPLGIFGVVCSPECLTRWQLGPGRALDQARAAREAKQAGA